MIIVTQSWAKQSRGLVHGQRRSVRWSREDTGEQTPQVARGAEFTNGGQNNRATSSQPEKIGEQNTCLNMMHKILIKTI